MDSFEVAYSMFGAAMAAGLLVGAAVALFNSWGTG